jgi:hypothetical protein
MQRNLLHPKAERRIRLGERQANTAHREVERLCARSLRRRSPGKDDLA